MRRTRQVLERAPMLVSVLASILGLLAAVALPALHQTLSPACGTSVCAHPHTLDPTHGPTHEHGALREKIAQCHAHGCGHDHDDHVEEPVELADAARDPEHADCSSHEITCCTNDESSDDQPRPRGCETCELILSLLASPAWLDLAAPAVVPAAPFMCVAATPTACAPTRRWCDRSSRGPPGLAA